MRAVTNIRPSFGTSSFRTSSFGTEGGCARPPLLLGFWLFLTFISHLACTPTNYVWAKEIPAERAQPAAESKLIARADVVSISVVGQPALSTSQPVGSDGSVVIPDLGAVSIGGLTTDQAEKAIESRLSNMFKSPQVSLLVVTRFIEVSLLGEVRSPGKYAIQSGDGVPNAIALAGGLTEFGNPNEIYLVRAGEPFRIRFRMKDLLSGGDSARRLALRDGDILVVK